MTDLDNKIESIFFNVLEDLKDYLCDLTLVGGWMPHIYSQFLWNNPAIKPVTTVDIDFGFGEVTTKVHPKTIFDTLSHLNYKERHPRMDRIYPVVLYKEGKVPIDFITSPDIEHNVIEKFVGRQISINKIDKFDFLLKHKIPIKVTNQKHTKTYEIYCPKPSAFLYHKGITFIERENEQKQAKDLHYMYFILRFAPDIDDIMKEITQYHKEGYLRDISKDLNKYFERISSQGCLMVEKENGPDEYIDDLRQDIFERFKKLRDVLS